MPWTLARPCDMTHRALSGPPRDSALDELVLGAISGALRLAFRLAAVLRQLVHTAQLVRDRPDERCVVLDPGLGMHSKGVPIRWCDQAKPGRATPDQAAR
jgi:hypothetical protein